MNTNHQDAPPGVSVDNNTPPPGGGARYRRRHYLIDPALQGRYFITMLILAGVVAFAVVLISAHFFAFSGGQANVVISEPELKDRLLRVALGASIFSMLVLPVSSLLISHRIAGPAYRLRRAADEVAAGRLDFRIHLRRHDYLKPAADSFNHMLDELEGRVRAAEENQTRAREAIKTALEKIASDDPVETAEALRLLEEAEARMGPPPEDDER